MAGFLLFLLVTLSVPHIKTIYLMSLSDRQGINLDLGVFGACYRVTRSLYVFLTLIPFTDALATPSPCHVPRVLTLQITARRYPPK